MRTKHTSHPLPSFPVYSSAFVSPNEFVLGGGGGQSKTGIKNKLRLYRIEGDSRLELLNELELASGEDAPMSMAAHPSRSEIVGGINSSEDALKSGPNRNCRVYSVKENKISFSDACSTIQLNGEDDDFQKVTVFSPNGKYLAVGGTRDLSVLHYPSLTPVATPIHLEKGEMYDAAFSSSTLVVATTVNLLVYALPSEAEGDTAEKSKDSRSISSELLHTIDRPTLPGKDAGSSFRAVRFHPSDEKTLYTVSNTVPPKTRSKSSPRRAFVVKWNTDTWTATKVRQISDRGVTCFDVSPDGKLLAFGSSDLTVGVLDAQSLAPLLTILKAHEFPPTTLRFSPHSDILVSGSADNTIRVATIPVGLGATSWGTWLLFIVALLVLLFAILAKQWPRALTDVLSEVPPLQ
ncbi:WD40 repeat-like protein [Dichomitus squalens LYAD-421 SS1]|uniref:WD40 repeat-like protein n=1 Tax=Dichomitus squalens (strain LYAD-421) TaxID=732165 RepID=UPI00044159E6|nr:WD40 repeat-like protein [Dichomitus squalens LYAD-421 SS1]EJF62868.1 WD40 repeat-like protein [Dichomitus squalens LYAD-421 SS1]